MSGPVMEEDTEPEGKDAGPPLRTEVEISESRHAQVGAFEVLRALPRRGRRTVGAWCFLDHLVPVQVAQEGGLDVGPHPHMGLQTVTWLLAGEVIHRDSLGSEQLIRPGELNLMTAGHGVVHSEERTGHYEGEVHAAQLWIAQPSTTRDGLPTFEHHVNLPRLDLGGSIVTVLVGEFEGEISPVRRDTDHVGIDLDLHSSVTVPLRPEFEYAVVVLTGSALIDDHNVEPGHLGYLGVGRDECHLLTDRPTRALLFGGVPFDESILMWWNFVARTQAEITAAYQDWTTASERFGSVVSGLPRIEVGPPLWMKQSH